MFQKPTPFSEKQTSYQGNVLADVLTDVLANAASEGNLQVVQLLLDQGVGASSTLKKPRDCFRSVTPLHEAVRGRHIDVCRVLSEAAQDYIKTSDILLYAARRGSGDICKILIDSGANVNVKDSGDNTPLHCAARADVCKILIDSGADVNARNSGGSTPLHRAAHYHGADVCKELIDAGANVNVKNSGGSTPLHNAACVGKLQAVELLASNNADVSISNNKGQTALQLAQRWNRESVIQYLQQKVNSCTYRV